MDDVYRLFLRKIPSPPNAWRCMALRDPTPPGSDSNRLPQPIEPIPSPLEPGPETQKRRHRWLHGLGTVLTLENCPLSEVKRLRLSSPDTTTTTGAAPTAELSFVLQTLQSSPSPSFPLFESLQQLPERFRRGSDEIERLQDEVQAMVDAFCCTTELEKPPASDPDPNSARPEQAPHSPLVGVPALIEAYFSDLPLEAIAEAGLDENGQLGPLSLAVLSGYVFDCGAKPGAQPGAPPRRAVFQRGSSGPLTSHRLELILSNESPIPESLPLAAEQQPEGFYLKVDWRVVEAAPQSLSLARRWREASALMAKESPSREELERINTFSDYTVVISRSVGAAPAFPGTPLGRTPALIVSSQSPAGAESHPPIRRVPDYFFIDRLDPRQFVGEIIHYQVELRDMLDAKAAAGTLSLRRERLDPPPMPKSAAVELRADGAATVAVEIPNDEPGLIPVVWFQRRALDVCGFYGTDDDLALLEGLIQADLNFDEEADQSEPDRDWEGHPVARYLRGAYDRHGLERLTLPGKGFAAPPERTAPDAVHSDAKPAGPPPSVKSLRLGPETVSQICADGANGARFFVSLTRDNGRSNPIESVLRPCDHFLVQDSPVHGQQPIRRRVFQIEQIPPQALPARRFLDAERIGLSTMRGGKLNPPPRDEHWSEAEPECYRLLISVAAGSNTRKTGGYRVYLRDVAGRETSEFAMIQQFEAVPPLIYRYRPFLIDSSRALTVENPEAGERRDLAEGSLLADARDLFARLEQELRGDPAKPRLTRASGSNAGPPSTAESNAGNKGQGLPAFGIPRDQLEPLASELKEPGLATLQALVETLNRHEAANAPGLALGLRSKLAGHWRILGPFAGWMFANGFARDLVLPLQMKNLSGFEGWLGSCAALKGQTVWAALALPMRNAPPFDEPPSPDLLATVRLCVLPGKTDVRWEDLDDALKTLLPWVLACLEGNPILLLNNDSERDFLPMDAAGWCHTVWDGLQDGWRHQIEAAVEELDRYAMARAFFADAPEPSASDSEPGAGAQPKVTDRPLLPLLPLTNQDLSPEAFRRFEIPRLYPPPAPPLVFSGKDPLRVLFHIEETQERLHATHNLLTRVRQGALTTLLQFHYEIAQAMSQKFARLGYNAESPLPAAETEPTLDSTATPVETQDPISISQEWNPAGGDTVEAPNALFFLDYTLRVRLRADHQEAPAIFNQAAANRLPGTLDPKRAQNAAIAFQATPGAPDKFILNIPLIRLWDLLSPAEKGAATQVYGADDRIQRALHWPDLAVSYTVLLRLQESGPEVYAPLFTIEPPGYHGEIDEFQVIVSRPDLLGNGNAAPLLLKAQLALESRSLSVDLTQTTLAGRTPAPALFLSIARGDLCPDPLPLNISQGPP